MQDQYQNLAQKQNENNRRTSCNYFLKVPKYQNNNAKSPNKSLKMEQQLEEAFKRLSQLEEENRRLKEDFLNMKQANQKLSFQKQVIKQKLEQKVQNINQFQTYLLQQNQLKHSEWCHTINQINHQLQQKKKQILCQKQEYRKQIFKKDKIIFLLEEQLENQIYKMEEFSKNDYIMNQKLNTLEMQNQQLQKDLIESQTSLFELHKSITQQKIKDIDLNQQNLPFLNKQRIPTEQTQTDTCYAIHNLQDKIQKMIQRFDAQKQQYKHNMESLIEYYENQLNLMKLELAENYKPTNISKFRNTIMSINQNYDNSVLVPLKQQILDIVHKNSTPGSSYVRRKTQHFETKSQFSQKYFQFDHTFDKNSQKDVVQQFKSLIQQSSIRQPNLKLNLTIIQQSQPVKNIPSQNSSRLKIGLILSIIAGAGLAVFFSKRLLKII